MVPSNQDRSWSPWQFHIDSSNCQTGVKLCPSIYFRSRLHLSLFLSHIECFNISSNMGGGRKSVFVHNCIWCAVTVRPTTYVGPPQFVSVACVVAYASATLSHRQSVLTAEFKSVLPGQPEVVLKSSSAGRHPAHQSRGSSLRV